jgi:hypothetical protein
MGLANDVYRVLSRSIVLHDLRLVPRSRQMIANTMSLFRDPFHKRTSNRVLYTFLGGLGRALQAFENL